MIPFTPRIKGFLLLGVLVLDLVLISSSAFTNELIKASDSPVQKSSWSKIELAKPGMVGMSDQDVPDLSTPSTTQIPLDDLKKYQVTPQDSSVDVALKASDLISSLSAPLEKLDQNEAPAKNDLPERMMEKADKMSDEGAQVYEGSRDAMAKIDAMKEQLSGNYDQFNKSDKSQDASNALNSQSDQMADQVASMHESFKGVKDRMQANSDMIEGMKSNLEEMAQGKRDSAEFYKQFSDHIKEASGKFEGMAKQLQDAGLGAPNAFDEARNHFSSLQKYVDAYQPYARKEADYAKNVQGYLNKTQDYLSKVGRDFSSIDDTLTKSEAYFRGAKVNPLALPEDGESALQVPGGKDKTSNACANAKRFDENPNDKKKQKPLETLQQCQKTCHSVCKQKGRAADGQGCFECPSGSPDTCFDVGALPADISWCKPGGICHDDPELHCTPFGALGPNKMQLQCTNCSQWPDECWQKVDPNSTNLTHCKQTCPGECVYVGKYKNNEWDGTPEFMHCYRCHTPPGPPSCEDLGWGSTTLQMCMKNCKDGDCGQVKITIGKDGKPQVDENPPLNNGPGGNNGGGNPQGGLDGNGNNDNGKAGGGTTKSGTGNNPPPGQGNQPNPPTDNPLGGNQGGGGTVAGDGGKTQGGSDKGNTKTGGPDQPKGPDNGPQKPPANPPTTKSPNEPAKPGTQDKPKPPDVPKVEPPSNPDIDFDKKWLAETKERIKSREDIIKDKKEGQGTKEEAKRQLDDMNKTREKLEKKIKDAEEKEQKKIDDANEQKKKEEEYYKTHKSVDYATEAKKRGEAYRLKKLKEATDNLKTVVKDAKDSFEARKKRIDDTTKEINRLKNENENLEDTVTRDRDGGAAKKQTEENNKKIAELTKDRGELIKGLKKSQEKYNEEIEKAKSDYRTALFQVDENARRKAETERIDEFFDLERELKHREQVQAERNKVFETTEKNMEAGIKDAKDRGDTKEADKLQQQLDNVKREQDEWNKSLDHQQDNIKEQMYQLSKRNSDEGAGPINEQSLDEGLAKYAKIYEDKLKDPNLTTEQKANLQAALDGIHEKQQQLKDPSLSADVKANVDLTTSRFINASMDKGPDKGYLQLAGESIVEEGISNMNPLTAAKKSVAFGWGIVQGVGTAVKGVAELGAGAVTLVAQSAAMDLGFDNGGIFGTSAVDTLSSVLTTASNNANVDGLLKAVVAAGGAVDAKINELAKSGDIDWATANFGGQIVGENVVGPELIGAGVGAAFTKGKALITGTEAAVDAANTATKVEEVANAANTATKTLEEAGANIGNKVSETEGLTGAGSKVGETESGLGKAGGTIEPKPVEPPGEKVPASTSGEGKTPSGNPGEGTGSRAPPADETPTVKPNEGPQTPPTKVVENPTPAPAATGKPATTVGPNSDLSFEHNGKKVDIKTGDELGHGSTSTAYVDANDPNKVIRVTQTAGADVPEASKLDEVGRKAVESIQKPDGPVRIVQKGERYVVNDASSPLNGKVVEVNERVQNGSADKFLTKGTDGKPIMSQGQAEAFDKATRELNNNGYAWMDNHTGNYGFEKVPGTDDQWKVVVIDPGGIVPMKGATLAERAENATALQQRLNVPSDTLTESMGMVKDPKGNIKRMIMNDERVDIMGNFGDKIDTNAMGISGPNDIGFYPAGTYDFKNVQDLAKMSPQEAAAYYASKK